MCLTNCCLIHQDEPIKCYKVLIQDGAWYQVKTFRSAFVTNFHYRIGETYNENEQSYYERFLNFIEDSYFHSFKYLEDCYTCIDTYPKYVLGKHQKLVIVECEIPIDSVCYAGKFLYWAYVQNGISAHCAYASKSITIKRIIK